MEKIIKKADIYFEGSSNNEMRLTVQISETLNFEEMMNNIIYAIKNYVCNDMKIKSIYFREEKINE